MSRIIKLVFLAMCVLVAGCATSQHVARPLFHPMAIGKKLPLDVRSGGVVWRGNVYNLVRLSSIKFSVDRSASLTARISTQVCCFDDVDYKVHAAVFDASGNLLGAAGTVVNVKRVWLGNVASLANESCTLDFGQSDAYKRARYFSIAISMENVLTPDQWMR